MLAALGHFISLESLSPGDTLIRTHQEVLDEYLRTPFGNAPITCTGATTAVATG